ncbi:MAG: DUF4265 domain-containing protein [Azoarcus sp.]|nr:DUF4265 domain-containing protein [Azoarcus sp.]
MDAILGRVIIEVILMGEQKHVSHLKIFFEIEEDNDRIETESLWAIPVAEGYQLDSIPFYIRGVACHDIVAASPDEDGTLYFTKLIVESGHSTVRLWFANKADVEKIRDELQEKGCSSEVDIPRLVAVDVPPSVPYNHIRDYLDKLESNAVLEYEEGCLGQ